MVSQYGVINSVFQKQYQVFDGITISNICNNDGVYDILDNLNRNMLSSEQKSAYSCLFFIDQTPDSYLIQL